MTFLSIAVSRATQLKLVLFAVLAIGVLAQAWFTTQVTSNANLFTAGTLRLNIADATGPDGDTVTAAQSSITFANMKPGDVMYAPIEIDNVGTMDLVYGIKYTTSTLGTQDLAPGLALAIRGTGSAGTGTKATTSPDAFACNASTYASVVPGTIWPEAVRTSTPMVAGTGEVIRTVQSAPGPLGFAVANTTGKDILCLQVTFTDIGSASNIYNNGTNGNTSTIVVFTFDGLVAAAPVIRNP